MGIVITSVGSKRASFGTCEKGVVSRSDSFCVPDQATLTSLSCVHALSMKERKNGCHIPSEVTPPERQYSSVTRYIKCLIWHENHSNRQTPCSLAPWLATIMLSDLVTAWIRFDSLPSCGSCVPGYQPAKNLHKGKISTRGSGDILEEKLQLVSTLLCSLQVSIKSNRPASPSPDLLSRWFDQMSAVEGTR